MNTNATGQYPLTRLRRNRSQGWIRDLIAEHALRVQDLVWPVFVVEGENTRQSIESMPGVERYSVDILIEEAKKAQDLGILAIALFPVVEAENKSEDAKESYNPNNLMCRAIQALKKAVPNMGLITDVALDPYTSHGHDGVLVEGRILNDETVDLLTRQAMVQATAGADIIAPSDMMDGRIKAIREVLDSKNFTDTLLLSYGAKYASHFYGPFRDAVNSGDFLKGDKKTYQMSPANKDEALREIAMDIEEGADMVMIKPGGPYLDIMTNVKARFNIPLFGYHVSGEYAMLKAAADKGWLDYEPCVIETLTGYKRAGCNAIFTYAARDVAVILNS